MPHDQSLFLAYLRALAISAIVLGHLGGWVLPPYTTFVAVSVPLFFFISGSVSYNAHLRSSSSALYLLTRLIGLLVPYYLAALICVSIRLTLNPPPNPPSWSCVARWLLLRPTPELQGFPFGQVWFLHTLVFITLLSPTFFALLKEEPRALIALFFVTLAIPAVQLFRDLHAPLAVFGHDLYRPIVFSSFYIAGLIYGAAPTCFTPRLLLPLGGVSLVFTALVPILSGTSLDCRYHTYSPDFYYIAAGAAALTLAVALKTPLLLVCSKVPMLAAILQFLHRHTFGVYLLHSLSIWLTEKYLNLVHCNGNYIMYAVLKFSAVAALSCALVLPFTALSQRIVALSRQSLPSAALSLERILRGLSRWSLKLQGLGKHDSS